MSRVLSTLKVIVFGGDDKKQWEWHVDAPGDRPPNEWQREDLDTFICAMVRCATRSDDPKRRVGWSWAILFVSEGSYAIEVSNAGIRACTDVAHKLNPALMPAGTFSPGDAADAGQLQLDDATQLRCSSLPIHSSKWIG